MLGSHQRTPANCFCPGLLLSCCVVLPAVILFKTHMRTWACKHETSFCYLKKTSSTTSFWSSSLQQTHPKKCHLLIPTCSQLVHPKAKLHIPLLLSHPKGNSPFLPSWPLFIHCNTPVLMTALQPCEISHHISPNPRRSMHSKKKGNKVPIYVQLKQP